MGRSDSALRLAAGGALIRQGRILLGKRSAHRDFYPNVWDVFGGHCGDNESFEETLLRELEEELGIFATDYTRVATLKEANPDRFGSGTYAIYRVDHWTGTPRMLGEEHSEIAWLSEEELATISLAHPSYPQLLPELLRQLR